MLTFFCSKTEGVRNGGDHGPEPRLEDVQVEGGADL